MDDPSVSPSSEDVQANSPESVDMSGEGVVSSEMSTSEEPVDSSASAQDRSSSTAPLEIKAPRPDSDEHIVLEGEGEVSKSNAGRLPAFLKKEAALIIKQSSRFHFKRGYIWNGMLHFATFAGLFIPFSNLAIPYLVTVWRKNKVNDPYYMDAKEAFAFQWRSTQFLLLLLVIALISNATSFPFLGALSGLRARGELDQNFTIFDTVMVGVVPLLALYLMVWGLMSVQAASARFMGKPYRYMFSKTFIV